MNPVRPNPNELEKKKKKGDRGMVKIWRWR